MIFYADAWTCNKEHWQLVHCEDGRGCKIKGNFRLKGIRSTNPVAVGDRVTIVMNNSGTAFITDIDDRRNYIIRKSSNLSKQSHIIAANVDQAVLVVTVDHPKTSTTFIDRFLASAEAYRIPVVLAFNKTDLLDAEAMELQSALVALYREIGYECVEMSAVTGMGVDTLLSCMSGKSTIINAILPDAGLKTADISEAHDCGMHTTTFSEMLPMPDGGYLIDTPGIKGFGTFDMEPSELTGYFREIFRYSAECRFSDCTHTHEPGCAVMKAVEQAKIALSRYESYLSMLQDKNESKYREAF